MLKHAFLCMLASLGACNPTFIDTSAFADGGNRGDVVQFVDGEVGIDVAPSPDVRPAGDVVTSVDQVSPHDRPTPPLDVVTPQDVPIVRDVPVTMDVPPPRDTGSEIMGPFGLFSGDLFRGESTSTVYYYARNGRRYVFPNELTYLSWYPSFDGIRRLTDAQAAAIQIGGNVTMRSGTWLVKITSDPKVYAVSPCGVLHWLEFEPVALTLYGPNWNTGTSGTMPGPGVRRSRDVPDAFFANYTVGARITTAAHPDGALIRYPGRSERYVVMAGRRRQISTAAFVMNRFQEGFVIETVISYPDGPPVVSYERLLSDPVCVP